MEKINFRTSKLGLAPIEIGRGVIQTVHELPNGDFEYHQYRLPGFSTIKSLEDKLIGWHAENNSDAYNGFKKESLKDVKIDQLRVFSAHKEKDLDLVFDAKEYIKLCRLNPPKSIPIVMVMLFKAEVQMISSLLGYPVIDNSQFKT